MLEGRGRKREQTLVPFKAKVRRTKRDDITIRIWISGSHRVLRPSSQWHIELRLAAPCGRDRFSLECKAGDISQHDVSTTYLDNQRRSLVLEIPVATRKHSLGLLHDARERRSPNMARPSSGEAYRFIRLCNIVARLCKI